MSVISLAKISPYTKERQALHICKPHLTSLQQLPYFIKSQKKRG